MTGKQAPKGVARPGRRHAGGPVAASTPPWRRTGRWSTRREGAAGPQAGPGQARENRTGADPAGPGPGRLRRAGQAQARAGAGRARRRDGGADAKRQGPGGGQGGVSDVPVHGRGVRRDAGHAQRAGAGRRRRADRRRPDARRRRAAQGEEQTFTFEWGDPLRSGGDDVRMEHGGGPPKTGEWTVTADLHLTNGSPKLPCDWIGTPPPTARAQPGVLLKQNDQVQNGFVTLTPDVRVKVPRLRNMTSVTDRDHVRSGAPR